MQQGWGHVPELITLTRNCRIQATKMERKSEVGDHIIAHYCGHPHFGGGRSGRCLA